MEAAKILAKEAAIVSQLEGLTEAAQGVISNAAAKYVDNNIDVFSDKRIRDYLEQYFSGAMGGGGAGLISKVPEALSAKRQIEKAQAAPPKEVTPLELTSPTPPEGPITPRGAIALIEPPSATPTVTTSGGLENLATMGGGLVDAMYDQIFKAYQRGTTQIAGNKEYILEVAKEQGRAFQSPDDIKAFVQEPGVGDRVQQLAQEDRVRRLAKAGKTPDEIKNALKAAGVSQADIQNIRQTQSDKNLDRAAVSGLLDPWLKPDLVSTAIDLPTRADTQFKQNEAVEYLKDRILTFDYVTEATKLELQELNMSLNDTLQMIKEYYK
ncbi:MAG: hypothetical protein EBS73_16390 [Betaproteobacteria bacterium]|nr:hypothetical protein [Betaproteobacteria bacterium]